MVDKLPINRIVGAKQTIKALKTKRANMVYLAENADSKVLNPIVLACNEQGVEITYISTMHRLGTLCGIDVGAAVACTVNN